MLTEQRGSRRKVVKSWGEVRLQPGSPCRGARCFYRQSLMNRVLVLIHQGSQTKRCSDLLKWIRFQWARFHWACICQCSNKQVPRQLLLISLREWESQSICTRNERTFQQAIFRQAVAGWWPGYACLLEHKPSWAAAASAWAWGLQSASVWVIFGCGVIWNCAVRQGM